MTHSVLIARLAEAGLDPTLFSPADLTRINHALRALPPVPAPPVLAAPPLPLTELQPLLDEIAGAAQRFLDLLGASTLLFGTERTQLIDRLRKATTAISDAIPGWMRRAEAVVRTSDASCAKAAVSLDHGHAALRQLACLHAAALIAEDPIADEYRAALNALEACITTSEDALGAVNTALDALDRLFNTQIPDLLDAAIPLFEQDAAQFSPAACRRAALALREAAHA